MTPIEFFYLYNILAPLGVIGVALIAVWLHERAMQKDIERERHLAD